MLTTCTCIWLCYPIRQISLSVCTCLVLPTTFVHLYASVLIFNLLVLGKTRSWRLPKVTCPAAHFVLAAELLCIELAEPRVHHVGVQMSRCACVPSTCAVCCQCQWGGCHCLLHEAGTNGHQVHIWSVVACRPRSALTLSETSDRSQYVHDKILLWSGCVAVEWM